MGPLLRCPRLFLLSCFVCLCPWRYLPFQPKVVVTRVTRWRRYAINLRQKTPKMHCFPLRKPSSMHVGFLTRCARKCQGFTRHPGTPGMPRKALVRSEFESTQPTQHKMQTVFGGLRPARPATRLLCRCHSDTVVQKFLRMMNRVRAGRIFFLTLCPQILSPEEIYSAYFQNLGGLSHGKIFSDAGVATKKKCGVKHIVLQTLDQEF